MHGAEGLFNMALTNGLIAIARDIELPELLKNPDRLPPARELLTLLRNREQLAGPATETLLAAINETDAARHGRRSQRGLRPEEIEELVGLDEHPSLQCLQDVRRDDDWVRDEAADLTERARAEGYLIWIEETLGHDEITRRLDLGSQIGPSEDLPDYGALQECPVCSNNALVPSAGETVYGYNISSGTCLVCTYTRSHKAAEHEEISLEIARLMSKD